MTVGTYFGVSPAMHRAYMYVPLLLVHGTISLGRLWEERPEPSRSLVVALLMTIVVINSSFLVPWNSNDTGFTLPSFDAFRVHPPEELRSLCAEHTGEDILYLGTFQHLWLEAGCRLSTYSSMSYNMLPLSHRYPNDRARHYKFLTQALFLDMLHNREFKTVVFDRGMLNQGIDISGVDYDAIQAAVKAGYVRRDLWLFEVYTAR